MDFTYVFSNYIFNVCLIMYLFFLCRAIALYFSIFKSLKNEYFRDSVVKCVGTTFILNPKLSIEDCLALTKCIEIILNAIG